VSKEGDVEGSEEGHGERVEGAENEVFCEISTEKLTG
jgi:hypothetical protein